VGVQLKQARTKQLARVVAEALGNACDRCGGKGPFRSYLDAGAGTGANEDTGTSTPPPLKHVKACPCEGKLMVDGFLVGCDEYLANMNTARRFWVWTWSPKAKVEVLWKVDQEALALEVQRFPFRAFHKGPAAAIEALAVACGLIEPETEKQT